MFKRRLSRGQNYRPVCLGWSEFLASYCGPFREETQVEASMNLTIPSMLFSVFDTPISGKVSPRFVHDVEIRNGVLEYAR
jgi:CRISPR-associated protein Cas5d